MVLGCYVAIAVAGVRIASGTQDPFARLVAVGVVTLLCAQVVINVGMSVGLLPITGMTLPFVSYGGSSLLCNFFAVALLISVSQHRPFLLTRSPQVLQREQTATISPGPSHEAQASIGA
jgi:cell division protein FtsW (lipid II flippase)